jgi:type II secretory pathway predicted ATPase ExeA
VPKTNPSRCAGAKENFTEATVNEIFTFSAGTPRLINKLCAACLIYGTATKHRLVDDHMVRLVIEGEMA